MVGVPHRGGDVAVTELARHDRERHTGCDGMGREGVPQRVDADVAIDPSRLGSALDYAVQISVRPWLAALCGRLGAMRSRVALRLAEHELVGLEVLHTLTQHFERVDRNEDRAGL